MLILGFALVFDFFWQYAVRVLVINWTKLFKVLRSSRLFLSRRRIDRLRQKIKHLEEKYDRASEGSRKQISVLRKLAKTRGDLRTFEETLTSGPAPHEPFVSIIIPCHNSEDVLGPTLDGVLALDYQNKEVLVVDDGSTDATKEVALRYGDNIKLISRETCSGKKTGAIMFGLTFARGDTVVVIDDDTIVAKPSLRELLSPLTRDDVAAVGGNVRVNPGKNVLVKIQQIEYLVMMEMAKPFQTDLYQAVLIISGAYGAFKKDLLNKVGAWDADIITEDLDLTWKLYRLKKRVLFSEKAVCYTDAPATFKTFVKQRIRWDVGLFQTLFKHRTFIFSRRFPALGFGLLPETIFFEIISVVARPIYLLIPFLLTKNITGLWLLLTYFYLTLEFLVIATAGLMSDDKKLCLKAVYAPVMLVYHQLLAIIRIIALYRYLTRKEIVW
jgi:cellulose synthase/poly-beta-1,6-N-acetylglucosamine synthase-like glycosyltransferase